MTPRALLSWAGIFSITVAISGGCGQNEETAAERAPRVVDSSAELFALDDAGTKDERVTHELVGDWTPPAAIETVRPSTRVRANRPEAAPKAEVVLEQPPPAIAEPPPPPERRVLPTKPSVPAKAEPSWQTMPERRGSHETAINVSVAIGAVAVGLGGATAAGDGTPGQSAFAIGALGVGIVSFSTALVLHLTEPEPKPATKTGVTMTPLGVRGTF